MKVHPHNHPDTDVRLPDCSVVLRRGELKPSNVQLVRMVDPEDPAFKKIAAILMEMKAAGVEINETVVEIALKLGRRRQRLDDQAAVAESREVPSTPLRLWPEEQDKASIVYYIRRGALIKIGTTTDPKMRFRELMPDEILAWEPGGRREEAQRHKQFARLRQRGEYFREAPDLVRHYKSMRKMHGDPDPTWRTTAKLTIETRPGAAVAMNATRASEVVGVSSNTIRVWARRKRLTPVGTDQRGYPLYRLDHIRNLRDQSPVLRRLGRTSV